MLTKPSPNFFASWIGQSENIQDIACRARMAGLADLLDEASPIWPRGLMPLLGHWLHFHPRALQSQIDVDGRPRRGGLSLLPPIALPRRMWVGSRIRFDGDIALGMAMERRTTIRSITPRVGRSGEMVFVTLAHEIACAGRVAIREEQDIVYGAAGPPIPPTDVIARPRAAPPGNRRLTLGLIELFRYSALTFNAHRIHYDRDYARKVEGYPGLVVQGALTATLLLHHFRKAHPRDTIRGYAFRAEQPLFEGDAFELAIEGLSVRAIRPDGEVAMHAEVELA